MVQLSSYYANAKRQMISELQNGAITFQQANKLQEILNQLVISSSFSDEIIQQLWNKIAPELQNYQTDKSFKVSSAELSKAWANYYKAKQQYKQMINASEEELLNKEQEYKVLQTKALKLQGKITKKQGDLFEAFLQIILKYITLQEEKNTEAGIDEIIYNFIRDIQTISRIKTAGSNTQKRKSGHVTQQKVDVSIVLPEGINLDISAKNYSKLSNLTLLRGALLKNLVEEWPELYGSKTAKGKVYKKLKTERQFELGPKQLMSIQGLTATSAKELKANVLIANFRNSKTPIRVLPTFQYLCKALDQEELFNKSFIFKTQINTDKISNSYITIKLSKEIMKLNTLKNFLK